MTGRELDREERPLMRALRGERVPDTDLLAVVVATGQHVAMRASAAPLQDAEGGVRGAIAIFTTIPVPPDGPSKPSM